MNDFDRDLGSHLMLAFFRWFCHPDYVEDLEGDLRERYHAHLAAVGRNKARWLLAKDVFHLFRPAIIKFFHYSWINTFSMKKMNWLQLILFNLIIILMIASPFLPGPANKVVGLISILGQLTGLGGLILLPAGIVWLIIEIKSSKTSTDKIYRNESAYQLAIVGSVITMFIFFLGAVFVPNPMPKGTFLTGLLLQLAAFFIACYQIKKCQSQNQELDSNGATVILAASVIATLTITYILFFLFILLSRNWLSAVIAFLILPLGLTLLIRKAGRLKNRVQRRFNPVPLYLVTLPIIAFMTFKFVVDPLSAFSRNYAIKRSESLIASIEAHKAETGHYPESLQELSNAPSAKISKPFIMGIDDNFRYNKVNDQYSLSFSQWLAIGSLEEIVLYDQSNLKSNVSGELGPYNYKLDLWRVKGAYASGETGFKNWTYYHCD